MGDWADKKASRIWNETGADYQAVKDAFAVALRGARAKGLREAARLLRSEYHTIGDDVAQAIEALVAETERSET